MVQAQLSWVVEQPENATRDNVSLYTETGVRSRKFHHKSRNGCKSCKARRIKCDEGRPQCGQCIDKSESCEYPKYAERTAATQTDAATLESHPPRGITADSAVAAAILSTLEASNAPCRQLEKTAIYRREHALELIDHFTSCSDLWLGSPSAQRILQQHAVGLSLRAPYLLHAILAVSAAHMTTLRPNDRKYWVASTLHYHHSLTLYSAAITHGLASTDPNAVFTASVLHAKLAFINSPRAPEEPALDKHESPSWLVPWQGVLTMLNTAELRARLEGGPWLPLIQFHERWQRSTTADAPLSDPASSNADIVAALRELCAEGDAPFIDDVETHLDRLDVLFRLETTPENIDSFIAFMAHIAPAYAGHVRAEDERALLILCYWCALFGRFDQWWIVAPAKAECTRICAHLEASSDSRIRALLDYPASLCGYRLQDCA